MTDSTLTKSGKKQAQGRLILLVLVVMFAIPIVGPYFYKPQSFVNHGELIQPRARALEGLKLVSSNGHQVGLEAFQGKWTMLIFDHASCNARCQKNLYNIRQVRFTQGRRMQRVQLAWVLLSGDDSDIDAQLLPQYPQVKRYNVPMQHYDNVNNLFATQSGRPSDNIQRVYFIDPFGNLVMSFAADQNPKEMQKDIGRLLRVSKAGEEQG